MEKIPTKDNDDILTLDAAFRIEALHDPLTIGIPEIFNTDQGAQFTTAGFTGVLKEHHVAISMDGKDGVFDNIFIERLWRTVKYEEVYLTCGRQSGA